MILFEKEKQMGDLFYSAISILGMCIIVPLVIGQFIIVYRYVGETQSFWGILNPMEAFLWAWKNKDNSGFLRMVAIIAMMVSELLSK
jgi:hypothetical protein